MNLTQQRVLSHDLFPSAPKVSHKILFLPERVDKASCRVSRAPAKFAAEAEAPATFLCGFFFIVLF